MFNLFPLLCMHGIRIGEVSRETMSFQEFRSSSNGNGVEVGRILLPKRPIRTRNDIVLPERDEMSKTTRLSYFHWIFYLADFVKKYLPLKMNSQDSDLWHLW